MASPIDYSKAIEKIEQAALDLNQHLVNATLVCGTKKVWDKVHRVNIPSIYTVNRDFNSKMEMLDERYQALTELQGEKRSLLITEEKTKAFLLNPLL